MGGSPAVHDEARGASSCVPSDYLTTDSVACGTSKRPVTTEPESPSSQSPMPNQNNNVVDTESQEEHIKASDAEDEIATVVDWEKKANIVDTESHEESSNKEDAAEDETPTVVAREMGPGNDFALEVQTVQDDNEDLSTRLIWQPVTRPISHDRLVAETKGIYASLIMVEKKCIEVDVRFATRLNEGQFQVRIALHRTLLHEHYDFFLASQHPSASQALKRLAAKYAMPERMWRHGIHSFLEILRKQLPESQRFIGPFVMMAYGMMSVLSETVPQFKGIWIECKGDLARYGIASQHEITDSEQQRWREISKEEYTRLLDKQSTVGRVYHHLGILEQPKQLKWSEPDTYFDARVSQFFHYTKALVVKSPFYPARESLLIIINQILNQNKKTETDKDNFLTVVAHLILASLGTEFLQKRGHKTSKKRHLQIVYAALKKIGKHAQTSRISPSPQLGLLLIQLMLGIPNADGGWSPIIKHWAADFVTTKINANIEKARHVHETTIEMINTMIPYLLKDADTRDLRLWEFIYVILVFMRSLKTQPELLERFGSAFHAELFPPFINMVLREDETRGGRALESDSQSEIVTLCSMLNPKEKLGVYGLTTEDNVKKFCHALGERQKAEGARRASVAEDAKAATSTASAAEETTVTPEEGTVITDAATIGDTVFAFKGSQTTADDSMTTLEDPTSDAAHERDPYAKASTLGQIYTNVLPEHCLLRGLPFAREAGAREQEELLCDRPLFPADWFSRSKYDFEEIQRMDIVQDAELCHDRSIQILGLVGQLKGSFFVSEIDEEGRYWVSVPGASSIPQPNPNMKMPEVVKRANGDEVIYVHSSFYAAELERRPSNTHDDKYIQGDDLEKDTKGGDTETKVETTIPSARLGRPARYEGK